MKSKVAKGKILSRRGVLPLLAGSLLAPFSGFGKTAQDIAERTDKVLASIQSFFDESRAPLKNTLENAETFSEALAKNADSIDSFLASVGDLSKTLSEVSGKLESTLDAAEQGRAMRGMEIGEGEHVARAGLPPEVLGIALDAVEQGGGELGADVGVGRAQVDAIEIVFANVAHLLLIT